MVYLDYFNIKVFLPVGEFKTELVLNFINHYYVKSNLRKNNSIY